MDESTPKGEIKVQNISTKIIKSGYLQKRSKYLKIWKRYIY
jgi:hypothetical protein